MGATVTYPGGGKGVEPMETGAAPFFRLIAMMKFHLCAVALNDNYSTGAIFAGYAGTVEIRSKPTALAAPEKSALATRRFNWQRNQTDGDPDQKEEQQFHVVFPLGHGDTRRRIAGFSVGQYQPGVTGR